MLHLMNLPIAIYLRPEDNNDLLGPTDAQNIVSTFIYISSCNVLAHGSFIFNVNEKRLRSEKVSRAGSCTKDKLCCAGFLVFLCYVP